MTIGDAITPIRDGKKWDFGEPTELTVARHLNHVESAKRFIHLCHLAAIQARINVINNTAIPFHATKPNNVNIITVILPKIYFIRQPTLYFGLASNKVVWYKLLRMCHLIIGLVIINSEITTIALNKYNARSH